MNLKNNLTTNMKKLLIVFGIGIVICGCGISTTGIKRCVMDGHEICGHDNVKEMSHNQYGGDCLFECKDYSKFIIKTP